MLDKYVAWVRGAISGLDHQESLWKPKNFWNKEKSRYLKPPALNGELKLNYKILLSYSLTLPEEGLKRWKRGFYSIYVISDDKFWFLKFGFLAFFEAKMTKIDILNQKLIVGQAKSTKKCYFLAPSDSIKLNCNKNKQGLT